MMIRGCTGKICLRLALCVVQVINMLYPQTAMEFELDKIPVPATVMLIDGDFSIITLYSDKSDLVIEGEKIIKVVKLESGYQIYLRPGKGRLDISYPDFILAQFQINLRRGDSHYYNLEVVKSKPSIITKPKSTRVTFKELGQTYATLRLEDDVPIGIHAISIEADGYVTLDTTIHLTRKLQKHRYRLEKIPEALVQVVPDGSGAKANRDDEAIFNHAYQLNTTVQSGRGRNPVNHSYNYRRTPVLADKPYGILPVTYLPDIFYLNFSQGSISTNINRITGGFQLLYKDANYIGAQVVYSETGRSFDDDEFGYTTIIKGSWAKRFSKSHVDVIIGAGKGENPSYDLTSFYLGYKYFASEYKVIGVSYNSENRDIYIDDGLGYIASTSMALFAWGYNNSWEYEVRISGASTLLTSDWDEYKYEYERLYARVNYYLNRAQSVGFITNLADGLYPQFGICGKHYFSPRNYIDLRYMLESEIITIQYGSLF